MKKKNKKDREEAKFHYAQSIFYSGIGDIESSIEETELALEKDDGYAPAILTLGSIEYQRDDPYHGRRLFMSLTQLPFSAADGGKNDLIEIIDKAGDFLIAEGIYDDGLDLYRAAAKRFPKCAVFYQGIGYCADEEGLHSEAIEALETALKIEPDNIDYLNDLGWGFYGAGRLTEAIELFKKIVEIDPSYELARENLRICLEAHSKEKTK